MVKRFWQVVHHVVAHPLVGFSLGRLWAWRFHHWSAAQAWPDQLSTPKRLWAGLD